MTFIKTASAALIASTIAFGALAPIAAPAFASDQGFEVPPVKQMKKSSKKNSSFKFASFDKKSKKQAKYLVLGAAVGAIGYALISSYENNRD